MMTILPMEERHIEALANLEQACFSVPWSENALRSELENHLAVFRVAEIDGRVVGYLGMYHIIDEGDIANIAVSPLYRRQGVGTSLINDAIRYAAEHKLSFLTLEVRASNAPAIALYGKAGFQTMGVRRRYYSKPEEDGLIMTWTFDQEKAR